MAETHGHTSIRYGERLAELGAVASIGSVGDSYDNALAEATNSLYKTELIRQQGPWRSVDDVELATLASEACTGSTPSGFTALSRTSRQSSSKPPTISKRGPASRLESNELSLHRTQCGPLARPNFPELLGVAQVADLLGITKQRVSELARDHGDFPRPVITLAATPVRHKAALKAFLQDWDRRPGPKRASHSAAGRAH